MKKLSNVILTSMMVLATFLYSCDKEIETTPVTVDQTQKATIKGIVYANLDQTQLGYEIVPAGTQVIITMNYSDIESLGSSAVFCDTVLTKADGTFEYEVPTDADGVEVKASVKFTYNQVQQLGGQHATRLTSFWDDVYYDVKVNETEYQKLIVSNENQVDEVTDWVTISGTINCDYDDYKSGYETLPAGTQVIFFTDDTDEDGWSKVVTAGADGKYSISIPKNQSIYVKYNFTLSGKNGSNNTVTYRFKEADQYVTYESFDAKDVDFNIQGRSIE